MLTAAAVLVCALNLIGRPLPPIVLLDVRPAEASRHVEAFVRLGSDTIYLLTTTEVFADARRGQLAALRKLASILVHEEWHVRHGPDERGAYHAQLVELLRLGESSDRRTFLGVQRAMLYVTRGGL